MPTPAPRTCGWPTRPCASARRRPATELPARRRIIDARCATGREAIHPGYGFLSEDAEFARAVEAAGLVFVGPTPAPARTFGLKDTARGPGPQAGRADARRAPGCSADAEAALAAAERSATPSCSRAPGRRRRHRHAGGRDADGTGRGVRPGAPPERRPASAAAGVPRALCAPGPPRRGADLRRRRGRRGRARRARLLAAAPPPEGDRGDARRRACRRCAGAAHEAAATLARSVAYRSAGTVEFVLDADRDELSFLEVNTRLQVEHGVTEAVTGVDLVEWMVRLAAGDDRRRWSSTGPSGTPSRRGSTPRTRPTGSARAAGCSPRCRGSRAGGRVRHLDRGRHRGQRPLRPDAGQADRARRHPGRGAAADGGRRGGQPRGRHRDEPRVPRARSWRRPSSPRAGC